MPSSGSSEMPPGVLVLGSHRSGTSLLAGIVASLGLASGPAERFRAGDQFNPEGYNEDNAIVEWHDAILQRCKGWASAPPESVVANSSDLDRLATILAPYHDRWFVKDPRQCLALGAWEQARGMTDRAVVIVRSPADAARSLQRRSTYRYSTAFALWERYNHDLLASLAGRPTLLLTQERLVTRPNEVIGEIAEFLQPLVAHPDEEALHRISARVRQPAASDVTAPDACSALMAIAEELAGVYESFPVVDLPPLSTSGSRSIRRRRAMLNVVRPARLSLNTRAMMGEALGKARARWRNRKVDGVTN